MQKNVRFVLFIVGLVSVFASNAFGQGKKTTSCGANVPLVVTIDDLAASVTPGVSGNIVSDGKGSYANGGSKNNNITAILQINNCTQDFTLNLNFSTRYLVANFTDGRIITSKFFNFDRVASVPITTDPGLPSSDFCNNGYAVNSDGTVPKNLDGSYRDNYGGCGVDVNGKSYVRRAVIFTLYEGPQNDHRLRFRSSPLDFQEAGLNLTDTAYIRVYHPTPNQWELMPESAAENNGVGEKGALFTNSGGTANPAGSYLMPFRIAVTKQ